MKALLEAVSLLVFGHVSTAAFPTAAAAILRDAAAAEARLLASQFHVETARMRQPRSASKPPTVLVIDDDPSVTETFSRLLALEGYVVRTALSAEAGLREAETRRLDAILLDLRMPLVDGLEFLHRLRARERDRQTPVAIVTGDYFVDDAVSGELQALGARVYFKPLWREDLVRITDSLAHVNR